MAPSLPPFAPFPETTWRDHMVPEEWEACLSLWVSLAEAHMALSDNEFLQLSAKDESIEGYLVPFMKETALSGITILGSSNTASLLLFQSYYLSSRLLRAPSTPTKLLQWEFLSDFSKVYGKESIGSTDLHLPEAEGYPRTFFTALKKSLIIALDTGIKGDLRIPEARLKHLNHLLHASPEAAELFLAGNRLP
ncbi:hypothetical protein PG994_015033 [Apiospora phragmitis]|uniref:Uncharacterized protein n=1 Tax=Apiospora phragmitis TaxID=2905665 RepID=A0ABR1SVA3_9PEZI